MPYHKDTYKSKHKTSELVNIVADVEKYPEFLPWVAKVRILKKSAVTAQNDLLNYAPLNYDFTAELLIKFAAFSQKYTSKVTVQRPETVQGEGHIRVELVEGPFKSLKTYWHFKPLSEEEKLQDKNGNISSIDFELDFEFSNSFLERLIGTVFEKATIKMTSAFIERCDKVIE